VDEVVAVTRRAAETEGVEGRVYNLGGGGQVSVRAAIELLGELAGRALEVEHAEPAPGDVRDTGADARRARAELGIGAATRLEDGLAAQLSWAVAESAIPA
jgi:nucleoside-diphosphate-sugar epimerase